MRQGASCGSSHSTTGATSAEQKMPALLGPKQQRSHARLLLHHPKVQPHKQAALRQLLQQPTPLQVQRQHHVPHVSHPAAGMTEGGGSQFPLTGSPDVQLKLKVPPLLS